VIFYEILFFFFKYEHYFPDSIVPDSIVRFSCFYLGAAVFDNSNSLAASGRTYRWFSKPILDT